MSVGRSDGWSAASCDLDPILLREGHLCADTLHVVGEDFAALWRDTNPALLRYLRVIAPEHAEDVASETWVQVVRGLPRFTGDETAWRAWLFTTARRRLLDQARLKKRHPTEPLDDVGAAEIPRTPDAEQLAMENMATEAAMSLLSRLPEQQAEVIMLRVVAGLDTEVVADMLGRSPGAIRVAAHRGLKKLATLLSGAGVTL